MLHQKSAWLLRVDARKRTGECLLHNDGLKEMSQAVV